MWAIGSGPDPPREYKPTIIPQVKSYQIPLNDDAIRKEVEIDHKWAEAASRPISGGVGTFFPYYQRLPITKEQFGNRGMFSYPEGPGRMRFKLYEKMHNPKKLGEHRMQLAYHSKKRRIIWEGYPDNNVLRDDLDQHGMIAINL